MFSLEYRKTIFKVIILALVFLILFNISFGSYFITYSYADFVVTPAVVAWAVAAVSGGVVFANSDAIRSAYTSYTKTPGYSDFRTKAQMAYSAAEMTYRAAAQAMGFSNDFNFAHSLPGMWGSGVQFGQDVVQAVKDFFVGASPDSTYDNFTGVGGLATAGGRHFTLRTSGNPLFAGLYGTFSVYEIDSSGSLHRIYGLNGVYVKDLSGADLISFDVTDIDGVSFNLKVVTRDPYTLEPSLRTDSVYSYKTQPHDFSPPKDKPIDEGALVATSLPGVTVPNNYRETPPVPPPPMGLFPNSAPGVGVGSGGIPGIDTGTGDDSIPGDTIPGTPGATADDVGAFDIDTPIPGTWGNDFLDDLAGATASDLPAILGKHTIPLEGTGADAIPNAPVADLTGIGGLIRAILNYLLGFLEKLKAMLISLFVPKPNYLSDKLNTLKLSVEYQLGTNKFNGFFDSLKNIGGGAVWEDIYAPWFGKSVMILKGSFVNEISSLVKSWISAFTYILLALYNYNQIYFLIRGTYPIKRGKDGD